MYLTLGYKACQPRHMLDSQKSYIQIAAEEAKKAALRGEVPVGAVLVDGVEDKILAKEGNRMREQSNPTAHAELLVIQKGCRKLNKIHLLGCDLYVTLEPCPMCAQAMAFARIRRLYFGAYDYKGGGVEHGARIFEQSTSHHHPEVYGGIEEKMCGNLLRSFFLEKRKSF